MGKEKLFPTLRILIFHPGKLPLIFGRSVFIIQVEMYFLLLLVFQHGVEKFPSSTMHRIEKISKDFFQYLTALKRLRGIKMSKLCR